MILTQLELQELFDYNLDTGVFIAKTNRKGSVDVGEEVGFLRRTNIGGYLCVFIDGNSCCLHRLAFLHVKGYIPLGQIDHIDGNKLNNSWANLREATASQNSWNQPIDRTNTTGVKGLYKRESKGLIGWQVRVMQYGVAYTKSFAINKYNNCWDSSKLAAIEYLQLLREKLHGEFTNHG